MALLEQSDLDALSLGRMIFHVVGPEDSDLLLMDEVDVGGLAGFFLDRVRETNVGNRFDFVGTEQGVRPSLVSISKDPTRFVAVSKEMAEQFQNQHKTVSSRRGAFVIAELKGGVSPVFALIKFDDLNVLRFSQQIKEGGGIKAVVTEINNTFQDDRRAMQKSALIVLAQDGGSVAVFDRVDRANVTRYFRAFLGVKRMWEPDQATARVKKAVDAAFAAHRDAAPKDVRSSWRSRLYSEMMSRTDLDLVDGMDPFLSSVFGPFGSNPEFRKSIERELQRQKISGELVEIDRSQFRKPATRRIKTVEDIVIIYPDSLDETTISIVPESGSGSGRTITIHTRGIEDDELVDATSSSAGGPTGGRRRG